MYLQDDRDLRGERTRKKLEKAFAFMLRVRISGRRADDEAVARARLGRARLRQRHDARDHAPDHPAARRHQVEPEGDAEGDRRAVAQHDRGLRRREPQRDVQSEPVSVEGACGRAGACARDFRSSDAAHRRLSRDLARRREDRGRRAGGASSRSTARPTCRGSSRPWWRCRPRTTSTSSRTISASSRSSTTPATSPAGT